MKFSDLDTKMRVYEEARDHYVLPGLYIIARLDGRSFTSLTKTKCKFEAPFDVNFRNLMCETTLHLMNCGFNIIYGFTQSDEISLLFSYHDDTVNRKERKIISILASESGAKFSLNLGQMAAFDCRISQLPRKQLVIDYFSWRQEDAHRNSLNSHCYWHARKNGETPRSASRMFLNKNTAFKNDYLFKNGINFNDLPNWQKRGTGFYWEEYEKKGKNPITNKYEKCSRRKLTIDYELPKKELYDTYISNILTTK